MRRREFIAVLAGAAAWPLAVRAQEAGKIPRIGYLSPGPTKLSLLDRSFLQGLRELGYVEGKNIFIEYRFAGGKFKRLPDLAAELVWLNVDVMVTRVTQASLAANCQACQGRFSSFRELSLVDWLRHCVLDSEKVRPSQ